MQRRCMRDFVSKSLAIGAAVLLAMANPPGQATLIAPPSSTRRRPGTNSA
jgi:hypothetical protein